MASTDAASSHPTPTTDHWDGVVDSTGAPVDNTAYSKRSYWDHRFSTVAAYVWLGGWGDAPLRDVLSALVPRGGPP